MSPRKYNLGKRAEGVERTRRQIVEATLALHAERGIEATSWDDVASRAGVGVGTVYRHFPSLDELLPACGELTWALLELPEPAEAAATVAGEDPARALAGAVFAIYERGAAEVENVRRERALHPVLAAGHERVEASIGALVSAGADALGLASAARSVARALVDVDVWRSLRRQGLGEEEAVEATAGLLRSLGGT